MALSSTAKAGIVSGLVIVVVVALVVVRFPNQNGTERRIGMAVEDATRWMNQLGAAATTITGAEQVSATRGEPRALAYNRLSEYSVAHACRQ